MSGCLSTGPSRPRVRQELSDIQTRTPSPSRKGSSLRIACSPSTPSTTQGSGATPRITVSLAAGPPDSGDSDHLHSPRSNVNSSDCDSDSDTHLVHLRARTRHNLLLSGKLSRSLEAMDERRGQSPHPPPSASKERRAYRPVSSRSMEDLEKAATVLRFTEHEEEVQQLLSSVLPPKGVHHGKT